MRLFQHYLMKGAGSNLSGGVPHNLCVPAALRPLGYYNGSRGLNLQYQEPLLLYRRPLKVVVHFSMRPHS